MSTPSHARASAMPRPMPLVEPVTTATRPSGMDAHPRVREREAPGMARDDAVLVGGKPPPPHPARRRAEQARAGRIRFLVELDAQPCGVPADSLADRGRVLAHAAREHQRIDPAE